MIDELLYCLKIDVNEIEKYDDYIFKEIVLKEKHPQNPRQIKAKSDRSFNIKPKRIDRKSMLRVRMR